MPAAFVAGTLVIPVSGTKLLIAFFSAAGASISALVGSRAQPSLLIIGVLLWAHPSQAQGKARKQLQISASAATKCADAVAEGMMLPCHANTSFLTRKGASKPVTDAEKGQPVVKKLYDAENSEWAFRLTIQIFNLSKAVLRRPEEQSAFRQVYTPLFDSLRECYDAQIDLNKFIEKHLQDVAAGRCVEVTNGHLTLLGDIEPTLNRLFKDFFVKARTVLYHLFGQKSRKKSHKKPTKSVTEVLLGHDLSFVQLGDDAKFDLKAQGFLQKVPGEAAKGLVDMLRGDRKAWSSGLIDIRNTIIHDVTCPRLKMTYMAIKGVPRVAFPTVQKTELREFVRLFWDNLCDAVEDTIVSCFNIKLSPLFVMCRLAEEGRDPQCPMRFQVAMRPANIPPGVIVGPPRK